MSTELKALTCEGLAMDLAILSTTESVYHVLSKHETVLKLKQKEFILDELSSFVKECTSGAKPGFLSIHDYTMSALAVVLEDRYRHGNPADPVVRYAEDFILNFAEKGGGEFGGTRRLCQFIMRK